ncbi:1,2-phenylacetyl-CoA epoxidase subunit PaaC [Rhodovulum visakhapatnamense]|uniref:Ring-1,2-phenylacetyl-CoA epoxidase subunit PaaC n=1 Tax=Rhodovulum visakhapatnamense TaxID=364297 RepID=A0A4R8G222_9RHOB|nr:1,2-phenylacetyl-CoA epoxidase subunit PaaC [Rhodovulum visakhapatnamense]TDX33298.1 ring-1,2-phenylacetyl-CoA epoxidase subunit PaaC [Rhodovulum visakhapatnamense]
MPALPETTIPADAVLFETLLRVGDSALILGHRVSEWCGHAPTLEEDIALANVALDLIGQATLWLGLAAEIEGAGRDADALAFRRDAGGFRNLLLAEQPNRDFAVTVMRQFLFDAWHAEMLAGLAVSTDPRVAEIAAKAQKEVAYHLERSETLVIGLGDGTPESHARMQAALTRLWPFTGEPFRGDATDAAAAEAGIAPDPAALEPGWSARVEAVLAEATLTLPDTARFRSGGRSGVHGEALGLLLAEMQFLQRAYPDARW